ncbi:Cytosolic endo-beta-N-acetylglucosaminidase [Vanrija pseudolonga]|uniref:Cytosolic endo-beta-N-acetylglucosaminidase n=1 Tax=Vanrija pseudolonga TaxID=143232 RepID=A0AAF0Y4V7_9TREE|nr:Cytosolic endo-beta-N-acetylglucosaminidase [Vanrija pseudolonga]
MLAPTTVAALALLSLVGAAPTAHVVEPRATRPDGAAGRAPHQPYQHGYNASGIKAWSADADPQARYLRSRVPLAARISPLAATQANPSLSPAVKVVDLALDYDGSFFTSFKYADDFSRRVSTGWSYVDLYGSWHGMPVAGSSESTPEHGVVNLPNPGWTDAAHRNGAKSLGCWFWPRKGVFGDYLEQKADGSFPVADNLVAMMKYFGFDGYFFNQEASISSSDAAKLLLFVQYLRKIAPVIELQWYDAVLPSGQLSYQNTVNSRNAPWLLSGGKRGVSSIFVNYWLGSAAQIDTSVATTTGLGLDPHGVVFQGTECEKYGFNPAYDPRIFLPESAPHRISWGLFGSHFTWRGYANPDSSALADVQAVAKRERQYWSGPNSDPSRTGRTTYVPYVDTGVGQSQDDATKWDGVAHYIVEKSVIGGWPFVTRFNTGKGQSWFRAGVATKGEWNNIGVQDLLPTWQFWGNATAEYDYEVAFDGGSSLKVTSGGTLKLYKTNLVVGGGESVRLVLAGSAAVEVGFADASGTYTFLPAASTWTSTAIGSTWKSYTTTLSALKGKTISAIALRFASGTTNVGELALVSGPPAAPATPSGFKIDNTYPASSGTSAEVFLSWALDSAVWYYDIVVNGAVVGRMYDEVYYLKNVPKGAVVTLEAVARDGARSAAASVTV